MSNPTKLMIRSQNPKEIDIKNNQIELERKVRKIFKYHIGKANAITAYDLFNEVFGVKPDTISVFERSYLWNVLKVILSRLRSSSVLFIVNNNFDFYVLQTEQEYKDYESKLDRLISGLFESKKKAKLWVSNKLWSKDQPYLLK